MIIFGIETSADDLKSLTFEVLHCKIWLETVI